MTAEIRTLATPSKLYRYRAVDETLEPGRVETTLTQEIRAIEERYLWCSEFRGMNDPMEGLYQVEESFRNHRRYEEIRDAIFYGKTRTGICSLSETATNGLMWAHYADQYRGLCIEYDFQRLLTALPDDVDVVRVHYDDMLPRIAPEEATRGRTGEATEIIAKRILSCKHRDWLYEREWRLLARLGALHYGQTRRRPVITGVIIGPRMPEEIREHVESRCRDLEIDVRFLEVNGYGLSVSPSPSERAAPPTARRRTRTG